MPRRTSEVVVEIVTGDLTTEPVDAIVLKHAVEALFGAEIEVDRKLGGLISATFADHELEPTGDSVCLPGQGISANYVLLVAIGSLYELTYKGVDVLARKMIQALSKPLPQADSFATTVHGPGIGLDPAECLKSQLLGFASALSTNRQSASPITDCHSRARALHRPAPHPIAGLIFKGPSGCVNQN